MTIVWKCSNIGDNLIDPINGFGIKIKVSFHLLACLDLILATQCIIKLLHVLLDGVEVPDVLLLNETCLDKTLRDGVTGTASRGPQRGAPSRSRTPS